MDNLKKVFITGSEGKIGQSFVDEYLDKYRNDYQLVCGYLENQPIANNLEITRIDITQIATLRKAFMGVDTILHLAGQPAEFMNFDKLIEPNIIGVYNVFEAARLENVKKIIFASSGHTVFGYPDTMNNIPANIATKPDCLYGASKVFGESLCSVYAHNYNMSCLAVRIGGYTNESLKDFIATYPNPEKNKSLMTTKRDLSQMFHKCIMSSEDLKFEIFSAISNSKLKKLDIEHAKKTLGFDPQDNVHQIVEE